ncbi:MAG: hypothetical protein ACYC63_10235 [Armatimonadota bacterium]
MYLFSEQFLTDMGLRLDGPLALRFVIQPIVAILLGIKDGVGDARAGEPPYLYDIILVPSHRKRQAARGWATIGLGVGVAVVLDVVVQLILLHTVYAGAAVIVGIALMALPYAAARALTNRIVSQFPSVRRRRGLSPAP